MSNEKSSQGSGSHSPTNSQNAASSNEGDDLGSFGKPRKTLAASMKVAAAKIPQRRTDNTFNFAMYMSSPPLDRNERPAKKKNLQTIGQGIYATNDRDQDEDYTGGNGKPPKPKPFSRPNSQSRSNDYQSQEMFSDSSEGDDAPAKATGKKVKKKLRKRKKPEPVTQENDDVAVGDAGDSLGSEDKSPAEGTKRRKKSDKEKDAKKPNKNAKKRKAQEPATQENGSVAIGDAGDSPGSEDNALSKVSKRPKKSDEVEDPALAPPPPTKPRRVRTLLIEDGEDGSERMGVDKIGDQAKRAAEEVDLAEKGDEDVDSSSDHDDDKAVDDDGDDAMDPDVPNAPPVDGKEADGEEDSRSDGKAMHENVPDASAPDEDANVDGDGKEVPEENEEAEEEQDEAPPPQRKRKVTTVKVPRPRGRPPGARNVMKNAKEFHIRRLERKVRMLQARLRKSQNLMIQEIRNMGKTFVRLLQKIENLTGIPLKPRRQPE